jgi:hypothetical protein
MPTELHVQVPESCVFSAICIHNKKIQRFDYSEELDPLIRTAGTITAGGSDKDTLVELINHASFSPSMRPADRSAP